MPRWGRLLADHWIGPELLTDLEKVFKQALNCLWGEAIQLPMWQSYKTFPELSVSQSWSFCKWKKHIRINHRKENGWLIHSFINQSWSTASLQAWQDARLRHGPQGLPSSLPTASPAALSVFVLPDRCPPHGVALLQELETPGLRAEAARGRSAVLSKNASKSRVWILWTQRMPISVVPKRLLYSGRIWVPCPPGEDGDTPTYRGWESWRKMQLLLPEETGRDTWRPEALNEQPADQTWSPSLFPCLLIKLISTSAQSVLLPQNESFCHSVESMHFGQHML